VSGAERCALALVCGEESASGAGWDERALIRFKARENAHSARGAVLKAIQRGKRYESVTKALRSYASFNEVLERCACARYKLYGFIYDEYRFIQGKCSREAGEA
jgi:hypothetical protein